MKNIIIALLFCTAAMAQQWTNILDPVRAADWTTSGVAGGIPSGSWTQCGATITSGANKTTTINNAITACGNNQFVLLGPGTFTGLGCIQNNRSNVVLRGSGAGGANMTKLVFSSTCTGGGQGFNRVINMISGAAGIGVGVNGGGFTAPSVVTTWTAGYAQGATQITLGSVSGLVAGAPGVGSVIFLDQLDDTSGTGYPTASDELVCSLEAAWCSNKGDGNHYGRPGRSQIQAVTVTGIAGNVVTISPGLAYPNWRSAKTPGAYWNNTQIHNSGLEDFTADTTASGATVGIFVKDGSNLWIKGVRIINTDSSASTAYYTIWLMQLAHATVESNYIFGKNTTCAPTFPNENYAYTAIEASDVVFDNNILQHTNSSLVPNDPGGRNVMGYNFIVGSVVGVAGAQPHGGNISHDLYEGNDWQSYYGDVTHGTHMFTTLYRNLFSGTANNNSCTVGSAIAHLTNNRFNNAVANVFGHTSYTPYEVTTGTFSGAMFDLGTIGNNSGTTVTADSNVKRTQMRWKNWDYIQSTNDNGTNDQTGVRTDPTEIPTGISFAPNPSPTASTLPASFYLTVKPAWFGAVPFPAIGPDVANGNAPNSGANVTGGHANKIPARVCYEGTAVDSAYTALGIKNFNAATCYGTVSLPNPPSGLSAVVH